MTDPLVPAKTPFNYNIGVNYESWENGRTGYSITADLDQITQFFGLIKTYHDVAVGTSNPNAPQIDPTQQQVINYVVKTPNIQLVMGTVNSDLAQGGFGTPWSAGLMTSSAYTDSWVQMIISAFGSKQAVLTHLKMILLGNEVDSNGPPPTDPAFRSYQGWINQAFNNLSASLQKAGLGSIAVSTTIANYGPSNAIAVGTAAYIQQHWSPAWNGGMPIVYFNQYTPGPPSAPMSGTNYQPVIDYFESLYTTFNGKLEPFIGETGYSTFYGQAKQITVYNQIVSWLNSQYGSGGKSVPLFAFDAFDQPTRTPAVEVNFGIFGENGSHRPTGLKPGLTLPSWSKTPIVKFKSDFNNDFSSDILVQSASGQLGVWSVDEAQVQSMSLVTQGGNLMSAASGWTALQAGDFNRDGNADILWQTPSGALAVWEMQGSQVISSSLVTQGGQAASLGSQWSFAGVGDFNGDGTTDILWRNDGGPVGLWQMNDGAVQSSSPIMQGSVVANPGSNWSIAGAADFNDDGKTDILWRQSGGAVGIWLMDGNQLQSYGSVMEGNVAANPGAEWSIAGTGDFNGDGKADILWRRTTGEVGIWDMDGTTLLSYSQAMQDNHPVNPGPDWIVAGTGDYDGNGMADILWRGPTGQLAIWSMNGNQIQSASVLSDGSNAISLGAWHIDPTT